VLEYLRVFGHVGFFLCSVCSGPRAAWLSPKGENDMDTMQLIILVVVLLFLFGGGGGYYYSRRAR
jgi:hypothetical protein